MRARSDGQKINPKEQVRIYFKFKMNLLLESVKIAKKSICYCPYKWVCQIFDKVKPTVPDITIITSPIKLMMGTLMLNYKFDLPLSLQVY